jgi:hypothetical protein
MVDFVTVMFPTNRDVLIDGARNGITNQMLQINGGHHRFALSGSQDYTPPFVDHVVAGTTQFFPLIVQFFPLAGMVAGGGEAMVLESLPRPRKSRKAAKKKSATKKKPARKKASAKKPAKKSTRTRKGKSGGGR